MKDNKWLWITTGCLIFWVVIMLWIDSVIQARAQEPDLHQEELAEEEYYDSLELLALCVEAEAGNQDLTGKRMVVDVVLNRVDAPDWPDTIEGVITQPYAFSGLLGREHGPGVGAVRGNLPGGEDGAGEPDVARALLFYLRRLVRLRNAMGQGG